MTDTVLTANQIILNRTDDSSFRSLWISSDREEAYWISLSGSRQVPEKMPVAQIEAGLLSGKYAIAVDSFSDSIINYHYHIRKVESITIKFVGKKRIIFFEFFLFSELIFNFLKLSHVSSFIKNK